MGDASRCSEGSDASHIATTHKVRPMGKLPKGMRWDPAGGCLVSAKGGCCKRKAAVEPSRDENAAPQRQKRARGA